MPLHTSFDGSSLAVESAAESVVGSEYGFDEADGEVIGRRSCPPAGFRSKKPFAPLSMNDADGDGDVC